MDAAVASYPSLNGKSVLITGGAKGIGRSMSVAFARQGASVVALGRDEEAGAELVGEAEGIRFLGCDVTDTDALR
ncbi:MAG TPA: SDR family NAD(P)-dependent oxidoreductase, partial [Solirubrobacterales bacterium]|nr:SDR family NAD(P)-dependent oxidoreductase [Solirubrobacterales bacterium]